MQGCRSTVDWPGTYFWRRLVDRHPRAKVLLTVRDPEKWYDSAYRTIFQAATAPRPAGDMAPAVEMAHAVVWDGTFDGRFADRDFAIGVFERHNEEVRRTVPADRLLEFEVSQGWEPLCDFLGRPVPDGPFPRLNDAQAFHEMPARHHGPSRPREVRAVSAPGARTARPRPATGSARRRWTTGSSGPGVRPAATRSGSG